MADKKDKNQALREKLLSGKKNGWDRKEITGREEYREAVDAYCEGYKAFLKEI